MCAPSNSSGNDTSVFGGSRRKVTTRFAFGGRVNAACGSVASMSRSAFTERTMVRNERPSWLAIARSAFRSSVASEAVRVLNATLPLPSTVFTSVKPAASKQRFSSGIFALVGLTPLSKAIWRGMDGRSPGVGQFAARSPPITRVTSQQFLPRRRVRSNPCCSNIDNVPL